MVLGRASAGDDLPNATHRPPACDAPAPAAARDVPADAVARTPRPDTARRDAVVVICLPGQPCREVE